MTQQLDDLFEEQQKHQLEAEASEGVVKSEQRSFLLLSVGVSRFLLPIEEIKEVTEFIPIRPYPTSTPKHIGVVNIRGEVVPVLSMTPFLAPDFDENRFVISRQATRLIILTCKENTCFGILASSAKKVNHSVGPALPSQAAVTLGGTPVRMLSSSEIIEKVGIAA